MSVPPRVYVLGEIMIDITARVPHAPEAATDTPCSIEERHGGSGANVAAWLAHLGVPVTLIGSAGQDLAGHAAIEELERAGVRMLVAIAPGRPTGRCIVIVSPDGERTMLPDRGANAALDGATLSQVRWSRGDHLHVSAYMLLDESTCRVALEAMTRAHAQGLTVSVDASSSAPIRTAGRESVREWTSAAGIVFANRDEAEALTGLADPVRAARDLADTTAIAVVKLGPDGAVAAWGDRVAVEASPRAEVVDTTGAGDAFAAGFLAAWLTDSDVEEALRHAVGTGSQATSVAGGRP